MSTLNEIENTPIQNSGALSSISIPSASVTPDYPKYYNNNDLISSDSQVPIHAIAVIASIVLFLIGSIVIYFRIKKVRMHLADESDEEECRKNTKIIY